MVFSPHSRDELVSWLKHRPAKQLHIASQTNTQGDGDTLSLRELERLLQSQQQWIPTLTDFYPDGTTLGAALARGKYHPRSRTASPLATVVLGGTFVTPDGTLFKSGSRVVKSVAGYDTHRAFVGSQGLFGVIVEVTLKVQPRPERFFRCTTSAEDTDLRALQPTLVEPSNDGRVLELAGHNEDIEQDERDLHERGLVQRVLGDGWTSEVLLSDIVPGNMSSAQPLLQKLRAAFDPSHLLY
jgi:hypothetical protein